MYLVSDEADLGHSEKNTISKSCFSIKTIFFLLFLVRGSNWSVLSAAMFLFQFFGFFERIMLLL